VFFFLPSRFLPSFQRKRHGHSVCSTSPVNCLFFPIADLPELRSRAPPPPFSLFFFPSFLVRLTCLQAPFFLASSSNSLYFIVSFFLWSSSVQGVGSLIAPLSDPLSSFYTSRAVDSYWRIRLVHAPPLPGHKRDGSHASFFFTHPLLISPV